MAARAYSGLNEALAHKGQRADEMADSAKALSAPAPVRIQDVARACLRLLRHARHRRAEAHELPRLGGASRGSWHVLDVDHGYKVKRIHVKPGCRLSYQTHDHRSEHWVVIFGIATCVVDGKTVTAGPGHSIDVPQGAKHRLCNDSSEELVIIEVWRGAYTGEDDIQRYEDDYGRSIASGSAT